jgi:hypothetical protein
VKLMGEGVHHRETRVPEASRLGLLIQMVIPLQMTVMVNWSQYSGFWGWSTCHFNRGETRPGWKDSP